MQVVRKEDGKIPNGLGSRSISEWQRDKDLELLGIDRILTIPEARPDVTSAIATKVGMIRSSETNGKYFPSRT